MSVSQVWGCMMSLSKSPKRCLRAQNGGEGVLKHLPLSVPCGPQSSLFFLIPYLSLQGWPMPDQTTEGEFPLPLPES